MKDAMGIQVTHCNNCPITPTLAAALSLMAESWLTIREHQIMCRIMESKEPEEKGVKAHGLVMTLLEKLQEEMKGENSL